MTDPTQNLIEIMKSTRDLAEAMRHASAEDREKILNSCKLIKSHLSIIKAWAKEK